MNSTLGGKITVNIVLHRLDYLPGIVKKLFIYLHLHPCLEDIPALILTSNGKKCKCQVSNHTSNVANQDTILLREIFYLPVRARSDCKIASLQHTCLSD